MKKNFVQDVVPPKKSIRNVTLSPNPRTSTFGKSSPVTEKVIASKHREEDDEFTRPVSIKQEAPIRIQSVPPVRPPLDIPSYKYEYEEPKKPSKKWRYFALAGLILVVAFGVSAFFKSAVIKVSPKQEVANLDETFRATKDGTGNVLGFQIVTVSKDLEKTVAATGEQRVDKKAQGKIVVYNENVGVQNLVATTRFETPEGLVFRLISPITVPARVVKDGKTVAGNVEVTVEADKVGPSYNIGLKDFTLPGLKGDPKYKTVYARSKTEMTGGFSGMQKVVSKELSDKTEAELVSSLKESLARDVVNQIPANFILYSSGISYKFSPVEQVESSASGAILKKKGTASAVIFDKSALSKTILAKTSPSVTSDLVKIMNLEDLVFSYPAQSVFEPSTDTNLNFSLKGSPVIVWNFDENKLKTDLLGLSRTKARSVLSTYDTIEEAWVETYPFWNQTIPKDPAKVTLVNTLTK